MKRSGAPYLSYKLELLKTASVKAANVYYKARFDLTIRELRVLRLLHDVPGMLTTELRNRLFIDKTVLSKDISYLERRGLISRSFCAHDNRQHRLCLTEDGQKLWAESEVIGRGLEEAFYSELSDEEWERLHELLDKALLSFEHWAAARGEGGPEPEPE